MAKSRGRVSSPTTQAVKVGVTRTGRFGNRVGGLAGREASGGRTGQTDAAVSAGSKAYGRSAPGTGVGGAGGSVGGAGGSGGGVVENTNDPGGYTVGGGDEGGWTDYVDPIPEPSVTPISRANPMPDPVVRAPITTPRTYSPVPVYNPPTVSRTPTPISRTAPKPTAPTAPKSPTVNPYTGFVTSGPAAGPNAAKPVPKVTSGPAAGPAAANPVAKPKATTAYQGIPYTAPKPAPKSAPAPAPKPAPKPTTAYQGIPYTAPKPAPKPTTTTRIGGR